MKISLVVFLGLICLALGAPVHVKEESKAEEPVTEETQHGVPNDDSVDVDDAVGNTPVNDKSVGGLVDALPEDEEFDDLNDKLSDDDFNDELSDEYEEHDDDSVAETHEEYVKESPEENSEENNKETNGKFPTKNDFEQFPEKADASKINKETATDDTNNPDEDISATEESSAVDLLDEEIKSKEQPQKDQITKVEEDVDASKDLADEITYEIQEQPEEDKAGNDAMKEDTLDEGEIQGDSAEEDEAAVGDIDDELYKYYPASSMFL